MDNAGNPCNEAELCGSKLSHVAAEATERLSPLLLGPVYLLLCWSTVSDNYLQFEASPNVDNAGNPCNEAENCGSKLSHVAAEATERVSPLLLGPVCYCVGRRSVIITVFALFSHLQIANRYMFCWKGSKMHWRERISLHQ